MTTTTDKTSTFTHHELLELMSIVRAIQRDAIERHDYAEEYRISELVSSLLDYQVSTDGVEITLSNLSRFNLWLITEAYVDFCNKTQQLDELALANTIARKLVA